MASFRTLLKEGKMTTKEAIEYYGGVKQLAKTLGVWPQTIYVWGERPPMGRQYELEVKTSGALRADREPAEEE